MNDECNWLDTKNKKGCKPRGLNIEGVEKFLIKKGGYAKPIGRAIKEEYGKTLTQKEWLTKGSRKIDGDMAFDVTSLGLAENLMKVNNEIKEDIAKHKKRLR